MKKLKEIRLEAGYTIHQVAEYSGVAAGLISEIERGLADNLKFTTVEKLSNLFHGYRDDIHKQFGRLPRDIFFQLVDSDIQFDELRTILNQAGV